VLLQIRPGVSKSLLGIIPAVLLAVVVWDENVLLASEDAFKGKNPLPPMFCSGLTRNWDFKSRDYGKTYGTFGSNQEPAGCRFAMMLKPL